MQLSLALFVCMVRALSARAGKHFAYEGANAAPNVSSTYPASTYCCGALEAAGFGSRVEYAGEEVYEASIDSYWSNLEHLHPWCLIQPLTAGEVSKIVTTLVAASETQECQFAVRSGGHTTWAGAANIDDGITIDLGRMNSTTYHAENSTVSIGVGARWGSVFKYLDALNVSSPGGRCDKPGVGGLVLGGGISYFNARKGFVCDNVANFEVVLASGEIVNANSRENPDLFQVLKGGSNNFGIVTKVEMETFDNHGQLWGGLIQYPSSTMAQHAKAFTHFVDKIETDPNASTMLITSFSSADPRDIIVIDGHVYTQPVERPSMYDEYYEIPEKIADSTRITNMSDLVAEVKIQSGWRQLMMTCTFQNDEAVLNKALELFTLTTNQLNGTSGDWFIGNQYHPIPKIYTQHSLEKGGNILGLENTTSNLVVLLTLMQWNDTAHDGLFIAANKRLVADVDAHARGAGKGHAWRYLDYAWADADVLASYGPASVARMRAAAARYDPRGVFQRLVPGGFKLGVRERFDGGGGDGGGDVGAAAAVRASRGLVGALET